MSNNATDPETSNPGHEPDNLSTLWISGVTIGMLSLILIVSLGLLVAVNHMIPHQPIGSGEHQWDMPRSGAGVIPNQALERRRLQSEQLRWLQSFGWQDPERTIVHIPMDRAIDMMIERKLETNWTEGSKTIPLKSEHAETHGRKSEGKASEPGDSELQNSDTDRTESSSTEKSQ